VKRKINGNVVIKHLDTNQLGVGGWEVEPPPTLFRNLFSNVQRRRWRRNGTASGKSPRNSPFISVFQVQEIKLQICRVRFLSSCWLSSFYLSFISRLGAPFRFISLSFVLYLVVLCQSFLPIRISLFHIYINVPWYLSLLRISPL